MVDGRTRFPDYAFRVGGRETFFAEAKKPSVNLDRDRDPAFQARSYGWSAKHPLAALTDFEEFALYDTRVPPRPGDDAAERRLMYLRFEEYPDRWGELAAILSRDAVVDGRFAAYAAALPGGRKARAREVDDAFLADIERWRERLAVDLAARNPGLSAPDLNFAVQVTIDRVVFLRICEDRGLETHGTLVGLLGDGAYQRLLGRFEEADAKYNSGLFHFRKRAGPPRRTGRPDPAAGRRRRRAGGHDRRAVLPGRPVQLRRAAGGHPGPDLRAVPGQGDPPAGRGRGGRGGEAGGPQGRRGVLHADLRRRLHRGPDRRGAVGGRRGDQRRPVRPPPGPPPARAGPCLRQRVVPVGGVSIPARLVSRVVRRPRPGGAGGGEEPADSPDRRRPRLGADDGGAEADFAGAPVRRGHRRAGGGGHQAEPVVEGVGGRARARRPARRCSPPAARCRIWAAT